MDKILKSELLQKGIVLMMKIALNLLQVWYRNLFKKLINAIIQKFYYCIIILVCFVGLIWVGYSDLKLFDIKEKGYNYAIHVFAQSIRDEYVDHIKTKKTVQVDISVL